MRYRINLKTVVIMCYSDKTSKVTQYKHFETIDTLQMK